MIRESCGLIDFKDVADEARTFLSMPQPELSPANPRQPPVPHGSPEAARRLFGMSQPITGTLVQSYLRERGITDVRGTETCASTRAAIIGPTSILRPRLGRR